MSEEQQEAIESPGILHDVFGYSFVEVAEIVGRTPAACRQLASSARRRVPGVAGSRDSDARQAEIVRDFKQAWDAKDIAALLGVLDPEVTAIADGSRACGRSRQLGTRSDAPGAYG